MRTKSQNAGTGVNQSEAMILLYHPIRIVFQGRFKSKEGMFPGALQAPDIWGAPYKKKHDGDVDDQMVTRSTKDKNLGKPSFKK